MYRVITAWAVVAGWAMLIAPASAAESCDKSFA